MTKDAVAQVKEAEVQAAKIRQDAAAEVRRRLAAAEESGKALLAETEAEADRNAKDLVSAAQQKADSLRTAGKVAADSEADEVIREAEKNLNAAVGKIVEGVMSCGSK